MSIRNVRGKMGKSDFLEANVYVDEKHLNRSDLVIYNKSREGMDVFAELVAGIKTLVLFVLSLWLRFHLGVVDHSTELGSTGGEMLTTRLL